jgi:hypothetical protein
MNLLIPIQPEFLEPFYTDSKSLLGLNPAEQLAIASAAIATPELLQVLATSADPMVAEAARLNVNWGTEADQAEKLEELLGQMELGQNDRLAVELMKLGPVPMALVSRWVPAEYLLANLKLPSLPLKYRLQVLDRLAHETTLAPRLEVAAALETPVEILQRFIGTLEPELRQVTQQNPNCPPDLVNLIESQWAIATDWNTDRQQLIQLSQSPWPRIRLAVAQNPETPEPVLSRLAQDSVLGVQQAVAQNPATTEAVLDQLADHTDPQIQKSIALHINLSAYSQLALLERQPLFIRQRQVIARSVLERIWHQQIEASTVPIWENQSALFLTQHPSTPEFLIEKIARACHPESIRAWLGQNGDLPLPVNTETQEQWVAFTASLLQNIASHQNASTNLLIELSNSTAPKVQFAVFEHSQTPQTIREQIFERLIQVKGRENWTARIASSSLSSPEMLEQIAQEYLSPDQNITAIRIFLGNTGASEDLINCLEGVFDRNTSPQALWFTLQQDPVFGASILEHWLHVLEQLNSEDREFLATKGAEALSNAQRNGGLGGRESWANSRPEYLSLYWILFEFTGEAGLEVSQRQEQQIHVPLKLIENAQTPESIRRSLQAKFADEDPSHYVYWLLQSAIVGNLSIPEAERSQAYELIMQPSEYGTFHRANQEKTAADQNTPLEYLLKFMEDKAFHSHLVKNCKMPQTFLGEALQTNSMIQEVLRNSSVTAEMIIHAELNIDLEVLSQSLQRNSGLSDRDRYRITLVMKERQQQKISTDFNALWQHRNHKSKVSIAQNWNTLPHILEELAQDQHPSIRMAVANNRNLSITAQVLLAQDSESSVRYAIACRNRALIAEEAAAILVERNDREINLMLAKNEQTPPIILSHLGELADPEITSHLLTNPKTPAAILRQEIPKIQDEQRLNTILRGNSSQQRNPNMPGEILAPFAYSENDTIRFLVARYHTILPETLELLAMDSSRLVRETVAENPSTSGEVLIEMARQDHVTGNSGSAHTVSGKLVNRKDTPSEALDFIARQPVDWMRTRVASHANTSAETLAWIAENESNEQVLQAVVTHPRVSATVLQQLATHQSEALRATIAAQPHCPEQVLLLELFSPTPSQQVCAKIAANPNTPLTSLELFVTSQQSSLRASVATNPNLPVDHLITLAQDSKVEVRRAVALNPATPDEWKQRLQLLIQTKSTPLESPTLQSLECLYNPENDSIAAVLSTYANSDNAFVRFITLLHPQIPETLLVQASRSQAWLERYATAENEATPPELRRRLQSDGNRFVRAIASR